MSEEGVTVEQPKNPPKPRKTEAEAALRGVDKVVFPNAATGGELWYRSRVRPDNWWPVNPQASTLTTGEMYHRVRSEECNLTYAKEGAFGKMDSVAYSEVCGLVSGLLRKQLTYKEFKERFWKTVEGPRPDEAR